VVVLGSINVDHVVTVDRMPRPGETVSGDDVRQILGGKGANQAVASARMGRATRLIGAVGSDAAGRAALTSLARSGVDVEACREVAGPTGTAMVVVDTSAENMIVVSPGANRAVDASSSAAARRLLVEGDVLLLQLEVPMTTVEAAARGSVATVVLNPAPAAPLPDGLWADIDVLVVNESELFELADGDDVRAAMTSLPVSRVVTTLGARGCVVLEAGRFSSISAPVVEAVDTTGAGDCFCGVLCDGLARSIPLVDAARRATVAAALSTTVVGAQASPTADELAGCGLVADVADHVV
jgi:ribokinase